MIPDRPDEVGLVWPRYGGAVWLRRKVEAPHAETAEELAAREGLTIKGVARPPKPPRKPSPYGSQWFWWVEAGLERPPESSTKTSGIPYDGDPLWEYRVSEWHQDEGIREFLEEYKAKKAKKAKAAREKGK